MKTMFDSMRKRQERFSQLTGKAVRNSRKQKSTKKQPSWFGDMKNIASSIEAIALSQTMENAVLSAFENFQVERIINATLSIYDQCSGR
jgi:hypothetical protein